MKWLRNRDADTVEVELRTGQKCAIRLIECWAPEKRTHEGLNALHWLDARCEENADKFYVHIPPVRDTNHDGVIDIIDLLRTRSFDRVPGRFYIGKEDASELLVQHNLATRERP